MATQRDIAQHLGLSQATVAQALAGKGKLRPSTIERVREAASALGYQPHHGAAALVNRRYERTASGFNLAYLTADPNSRLTDFLPQQVKSTATNFGYAFDFIKLSDFPDLHILKRQFAARGVAGVILATSGSMGTFPKHPLWEDLTIPKVALFQGSPHLPVHRVCPDYHREGEAATLRAIRRGYRRIAFANAAGRDASRMNHIRRSGYLNAMDTHGLTPIPTLELPIGEMRKGSADLVQRFDQWRAQHAVDCVISGELFWGKGPSPLALELHEQHQCGLISLFVDPDEDRPFYSGFINAARPIAGAAVRLIDSYIRYPTLYQPIAAKQRTVLIAEHWVEGVTLPQKQAPDHREV